MSSSRVARFLLLSVLLVLVAASASAQQTESPAGGAAPPGGKGPGGPGGKKPPLKAALEPLGLQQLERAIVQALRSSGKRFEEARPLLDKLAADITSAGTDRSAVLARVEKFASDNGLSSAMQAALAAAKAAQAASG